MIVGKAPAHPEMFRAGVAASDSRIGVDRESNVIRGYAVAEEGRTKTPGRGEFDSEALGTLMQLGNAERNGVRIRFQHPSASDDGLGKYVGRAKNFRIDTRDGRSVLRADAHIDKTAMEPGPDGGKPRGLYLMDLAESDPGAFQSSVVMSTDKLQRDPDADGNSQPPIYRPTKLWASDFVDEGDAVHGDLFSVEGLDELMEGSERRIPTKVALAASQYLDQMFPESDRDVLQSRFLNFCNRYLDARFGAAEPHPDDQESEMDQETKEALAKIEKNIEALTTDTRQQLGAVTAVIEEQRKERKAELSSQERASEITALCEMSGVAEKGEATKWIADLSFSVDGVRKELFERKCKRNPPADDDPESEESLSAGKPVDENAKYREEYIKNKTLHEKLGITEARFIKRRRKEEGLPELATA